MTAAVTREYKITWGTFVVAGTTERILHGPVRVAKAFEQGSISFQVSVRGTSDATFAANCAEMESEFTKRRQRILFQIGASTFLDWNPSGNTGFDQVATCEKAGTEGADSGRSRLYDVTLTAALPATDENGRRDMRVSVEWTASRIKIVTIEGTFTALTGNDATDQYESQIAALCASVLSGIGGTYDSLPINEKTDRNDQDKVIEFVRVYRQKIFNQSAGSLNNAAIVEDSLTFRRAINQPGDSRANIKRLEDILVSYACSVDRNQTTDLTALYDDTIRPFLVSTFESEYSPSQKDVVSEEKIIDPVANTIGAAIVFRAAIDTQTTIMSMEKRKIIEDPETVLTGVWSGKFFTKYVDQGIGTRRRLSIRAVRKLGVHYPIMRVGGASGEMFGDDFGTSGAGDGGGAVDGPGGAVAGPGDAVGGGAGRPGGGAPGGGGAGGGRWVMVSPGNQSEAMVSTEGVPGEEQITYTDLVESYVEEWVVEPDGGGSGPPTTPGDDFPGGPGSVQPTR